MKHNPLTVWTFPCRKRYYLTHPWKWCKEFYWNFRNWIHRANYGYAYTDVWNFCDWYPRVAAEALRYLAKHGNGYPGIKPWDTHSKWCEYLEYLANRLERCANSMDIGFGEERNEYDEAFWEIMNRTRVVDENGMYHIQLTPEEEEIRKKYFERAEEIRNADEAYDIETFRWIGEDIRRLWD